MTSPCPAASESRPAASTGRGALQAVLIPALCVMASPVMAQDPVAPTEATPAQPLGGNGGVELGNARVLTSPVLTLDQDALFAGSAFGKRVQQELERDRAALAQENRRIEAELVQEELALTEQRESTPADVFADFANAFDRKVQEVRETQDVKSIQLQQRLDRERQAFLGQAGRVIAELVRRRGGIVVIDRNVILLSFEGVDITEDAITAIDAAIGSGSSQKLAPPAPLQRPGTGPDTVPSPE